MKPTGLSLNDYIDATDGIIDTIWELRLNANSMRNNWRDEKALPSVYPETRCTG